MTNEDTFLYDATYSAEDNSLRIYGPWMDDELYAEASDLGFKYARIQELYVAKKWTPAREDFCIKLAGEITAEQTTMVERAEAKADRLDNLASKRAYESDVYHKAANRISERFAYGQPILVGHHSEKKARRDKAKMDSAMEKAVKAHNAVSYWNYRAAGVEHHANRKSNPAVRARRIKTLLAELRDRQRDINHANKCLSLWEDIKKLIGKKDYESKISFYCEGNTAPIFRDDSLSSQYKNGDITSEEVIDICLGFHTYQAANPFTYRWINHILNRLAFERSELGEVSLFDGDLTATILQAFARENGAEKPKAIKTENGFKLVSKVPLPLHIAESNELELTDGEWRNLMQSTGHEVSPPKPKAPPILNFKAVALISSMYGNFNQYSQIEMTKAEYSAIHTDYRGIRLSSCGTFKFRTCMHRAPGAASHGLVAVFLTDSKVHDVPESPAIRLEGEGEGE